MTTALLAAPLVDSISRRGLLAGIGAAGLLTACGTGSTAPGPTAATREVVDGAGRTVVIPAEPQRILVISALYDQSQLADLGVTPYAVSLTGNPVDRMPPALRAIVENAEPVGTESSEVDAEQIAALAPDLILHSVRYGSIAPEVVQRIAPTLSFGQDTEVLTLAESLRRLAGWLGRPAEAEAVLTRWDERLAELAAELDLGGRSFSLVFPIISAANFQLLGPESEFGRVITALGGTVVPEQVGGAPLTDYAASLSFEVLPDLVEADTALLIRYYNAASAGEVAQFTADPLWQAADVVARGDVITLDIQDVSSSHGYAGLENAVRTVADALTANPR